MIRSISCFLLVVPLGVQATDSYAQAGVSIDAGNALVERIKPLTQSTARVGADGVIGGFGGVFDLAQTTYHDPLLISTTDGVGTKLKIAQAMGQHDTIGIDLVAMCVNDLLAHGAEPLFFLDYFATGALDVDQASHVIQGIALGCQESGCTLSGGETAEMPGMYADGEYDLAGFAVGVVERDQMLPRLEAISTGDVVIGLASSGVHSNGYSLVRHCLKQHGLPLSAPVPFFSQHRTIGEALIEPTKIYVQSVLPLIKQGKVKGVAHITGGGLLENIPRILPKDRGVQIDLRAWHIPPIFNWIAQLGSVSRQEMLRTFNLGIGMVLIVSAEDATFSQAELERRGERSWCIGQVIPLEEGEEQVRIEGASVLIIGDGGREHALAWKAQQSLCVDKIFVAPGNGGTAAEKGICNVPVRATDVEGLVAFATQHKIDLTIVGSEMSLAAGIVDAFSEQGLRCFGPSIQASQLESSKIFSKDFMERHHIPTARYESFSNCDQALAYANRQQLPVVIKASGLASGKGVIIAHTHKEVRETLQHMMIDRCFGPAGEHVVIEEYLEGEELSFIIVTDGEHCVSLAASQDHKRRDDADRGPNTGGMGAYSPVSILTPQLQDQILSTIIRPTIEGMRLDNIPYRGFLYVGLMLTPEGPKVLEYNCRLGDPEAEPLLLRMRSDLVTLCNATLDERLDQIRLDWDPRPAIGVVLTSADYPNHCSGGDPIAGLPCEGVDFKIFHSRTEQEGERFKTTGGRVLCVTALGCNMSAAAARAYQLAADIHWPGIHYRTDIGYREIARDR